MRMATTFIWANFAMKTMRIGMDGAWACAQGKVTLNTRQNAAKLKLKRCITNLPGYGPSVLLVTLSILYDSQSILCNRIRGISLKPSDQIVLVTGAGRGIGQAAAELLAA